MTKTEMRDHLRHSRYIVSRDMVEGDYAEAIGLDPEARELAIFRTEAARHLSGDELVRAVDAYADDLRKRDQDAAEGRCEACGERVMFDDPHANLCPLDPDTLEEAGERVRALLAGETKPTAEGLDVYARLPAHEPLTEISRPSPARGRRRSGSQPSTDDKENTSEHRSHG